MDRWRSWFFHVDPSGEAAASSPGFLCPWDALWPGFLGTQGSGCSLEKSSLLSSHGASCHQGKGSHFWLTEPQPSVSTSEESSLVIMNIKKPMCP